MEWTPAGLRSLVKPQEANLALHPVSTVFSASINIIQGFAIAVAGGKVTVGEKPKSVPQGEMGHTKEIPYDILLVATGGKYDASSTSFLKSPTNATNVRARIAQFEAKAEALRAAKQILIVGSGAMGTELAAEIKHEYPQKEVTLAGRSAMLLPGFSAKSQSRAASHMAKVGVKVELNKNISHSDEAGYDLVYHCTGFTPSTDFLKDGDLAGALDTKGFVKTGPDGLVSGQKNVFAFGDIVTPGHMEAPFLSGYAAGQLAPKIAANIVRMSKGKATKSLGKAPAKTGGVVSLGPAAGVGNFDGFNLPMFIVVMMKSKDVFRKKYAAIFRKK